MTESDIPEAVSHHTKRSLLDYLGAAIAGSTTPTARIVREHAEAIYAPGAATVIGGDTLIANGAALANGAAAHALELDDGYTPGAFHPGSPIFAALLAVAEAVNASAEDTMVAAAIGFELSCRIAEAGHPSTMNAGFHNTPIAAVFGVAAASARLFGHDENMLLHALGIAGSHAGGLLEFLSDGAEVKRAHPGLAASGGIASAQLAARGLTGPHTVLEGERGYLRAFGGSAVRPSVIRDALGENWRMLDTYAKPYPCCRQLHSAVDAVLEARKMFVDRGDDVSTNTITRVHVEIYPFATQFDHRNTDGFVGAQMSLPYVVAAGLQAGQVSLAQFSRHARNDPALHALMDKVDVVAVEGWSDAYPPRRPVRVTLETIMGTVTTEVWDPSGAPENPITDEGVTRKTRGLCTPVLGEDVTDRLIENVWHCEELDGIFAAMRVAHSGEAVDL